MTDRPAGVTSRPPPHPPRRPSFRPWRPDAGGPSATALSAALAPAALLYGAVAARRLRTARPAPSPLPTIGVGSPVAGGAGKTPTALALGRAALAMGLAPGFLARGHGRETSGTLRVDPARHAARDVGDEPLLLAALGPTVVSVDRAEGAGALAGACDLIVMDDGFQSRRLQADPWLLVVDGAAGIGNGRCLPAGPLRAPLPAQIAAADALAVVDSGRGTAGTEPVAAMASARGLPVYAGHVEPLGDWRGREVAAFSGLADPAKFLATLERAGARVVASLAFPDHHAFTARDLDAIRRLGEAAPLVTTAKDAARLDHDAPAHEVLRIELRFAPGAAEELIERAIAAHGSAQVRSISS